MNIHPFNSEIRKILLRPAIAAVFVFCAMVPCLLGQDLVPRATPFRLGISAAMFTDLNVNDAKAAMKAWFEIVAKRRGIWTDPEPVIFNTRAELAAALRSNLVNAAEMTVSEFAFIHQELQFDPIFAGSSRGRSTEEYLLLTRQDGKFDKVGDLAGRRLLLFQHYRACLAEVWLDTYLIQEGLPAARSFFAQLTEASKVSRVILPVFFKQADACLVTRGGFELMCELNPQVGKQLRVLATSPGIVPAVFCFLANTPGTLKEQYAAELLELHRDPVGQQVLTLFYRDRVVQPPPGCLDEALALLRLHDHLCAATNHIVSSEPGPKPNH